MDYLGEAGVGAPLLVPGESHKQSGNTDHRPVQDAALPPGVTYSRPGFPWFNAFCGDIDLIGDKKPQSYFRDVVWGRSILEMAVQRPLPAGQEEEITRWGWSDELRSWTWPGLENRPLKVRIYAKADQVSLLLNDRQVGLVPIESHSHLTAEFLVPYVPGELKAVALTNGKPVAHLSFRTTGLPSRIMLYPDRHRLKVGQDDLSYIAIQIEDDKGNLVPDALSEVQLSISGPGTLAGIGECKSEDNGQLSDAPTQDISWPMPCRNPIHRKTRNDHRRVAIATSPTSRNTNSRRIVRLWLSDPDNSIAISGSRSESQARVYAK